MTQSMGAKLTTFVLQRYARETETFTIALKSRAVTDLPQDLGRVAANKLGDTFTLHHCMFMEPPGKITQELLNICTKDTLPPITLSLLFVYPPDDAEDLVGKAVRQIGTQIQTIKDPASANTKDKSAASFLDCSSTSVLWKTGPLIIMHPYVFISPTALPTFSYLDCAMSLFTFCSMPNYAMHVGNVLHRAVQLQVAKKTPAMEIEHQLNKLTAKLSGAGVPSCDVDGVIARLKDKYYSNDIKTNKQISNKADMESYIIYNLLNAEPELGLQNGDVPFATARANIDGAPAMAEQLCAVVETLRNRCSHYDEEQHVLSTDLGMQGKIDLYGRRVDKETGKTLEYDIIELKTTSTNGSKREMHFMQACTYLYVICCEQHLDTNALVGCDVVALKKATSKQPFKLFGTKSFITYTELANRQPFNPAFYFLQLYSILRATYIIILELSNHFAFTACTVNDLPAYTAKAETFISTLRQHEPKCCLERTDYSAFLAFVYGTQSLASKTLTVVRKDVLTSIMFTHRYLTGDSLAPVATLEYIQSHRVGANCYSLFRIKSGSMETGKQYRLRFFVTPQSAHRSKAELTHCIASNIFVRVLNCTVSSNAYQRIALTESAYDLSQIYTPTSNNSTIQESPTYKCHWSAYPTLPEGSIAGRAVAAIMSQQASASGSSAPANEGTISHDMALARVDKILLDLEQSVKWCSIKRLEEEVAGPFYNKTILLLVREEEVSLLPKSVLNTFDWRGLCMHSPSCWIVPASSEELDNAMNKQISPDELLKTYTSRFSAFCSSKTCMLAASPADLLNYPVFCQKYDTVYAFADINHSMDRELDEQRYSYDYTLDSLRAELYAVLATLPTPRKIFFIT